MILNDFKSIDFSKLKLPIIAIYEKPLDYPDRYVARLWDMDKPTEYIVLADSLDEIREKIPYYMIMLQPHENDDKKIVEIWI